MGDIVYLHGDATDPAGPGPRIIAHICNDVGGWGRGFVLALGRRYPEAKLAYKMWFDGTYPGNVAPFALGSVQLYPVIAGDDPIWVANMIAQRDIKTSPEGIPPIRYEALGQCLRTLSGKAQAYGATVHMPRIGCGLAGGEWYLVENLVHRELCARGVSVTVYDYDGPGPEVVSWQK